jgi:predicted amidohydrolase
MKLACVQLSSNADIQSNISKISDLVAKAAGQGAQLVGLPENAFLMRDPDASEPPPRYEEAQHPAVLASAQLAKQRGIWLLVGSIAIAAPDGKNYNRCLLFSPDGALAARYDKIHLFDVTLPSGQVYAESPHFVAGGKAVLAQAAGAKLGLSVCYDVRFPALYRQLAKAGAQLLCVPAAFTQATGEAHWHTLLQARAIENGFYVFAPAQTGAHPGGRHTFGHSLIIDPWGKVLADAGKEEGVIVADIDLGLVEKTRGLLPSLAHERAFSLDSQT